MKKYLEYLWYVLRHKWYVFLYCCKFKVPFLGIIHDCSKFTPTEFIPYANFFYGRVERRKTYRDKTGYYKPVDTGDPAFDMAWVHHQKNNKHHWQWWIIPDEGEKVKVMDMPEKYRREMLADWMGAGKAQGTPDVNAWYNSNKSKLRLHPNTQVWIEEQLSLLQK